MSLLAQIQTGENVQEEQDVLGGGYTPLATGIYPSKVTMAYMEVSKKGAIGVNLALETTTGQSIRQTIWMTSNKEKGCKNFYIDQKTGEQKQLPGFALVNSLALLTAGKSVAELASEEKLVNIYSYDAKKEVATKVDVLTELLNKEVYTAVFQQIEDKRAQGVDGQYHPTGQTRTTNDITKFFRAADKLTTAEIRGGAKEPGFFNDWEAKFAGTVKDLSTGAAAGNGNGGGSVPSPFAASVAPQAANQKPTQSLFAAPTA